MSTSDSTVVSPPPKRPVDRAVERFAASPLGRFSYRFRKLVPLASFVIGVGSYFLVQRQNSLAQWLTALMMLGWVALLFEGLLCRVLARVIGDRLPQILVRYATQSLHQETLFFVLPFFLATTTWMSSQVFFTGLLIVAAVVSVIDPLYCDVIGDRRWLFFAFHSLAMFAALLTAGPIIGSMTTGQTIAVASAVMGVCALPSFSDVIRVQRWRRFLVLVGLSIVLGGGAWMCRFWIPPATLAAKDIVVTTHLNREQREPGSGQNTFTVSELQGNGLFAFSAIKAPRGLHQQVLHVWSHDGKVLDRITLEIAGSRGSGYRTWSHVTRFGKHPEGKWKVRVVTDEGQLIGVERFTVVRD